MPMGSQLASDDGRKNGGRHAFAIYRTVARSAGRIVNRAGAAPSLVLLTAIIGAIASAAGSIGEEPVTPLRSTAQIDAAKADLGRKLFSDVRLSGANTHACVSCHRLERGGGDGRGRPPGADARPLDYNSPSIFNAALNYRLNWRGNFRRLEEQNEAVLLDHRLMNTTWDQLLAKLRADQDYVRGFTSAYGSEPRRAHVLDALAAFQQSLLTPNARFDRYLSGQRDAITSDEEHGYQLFKSYGCIACHQGMNLGGNLFQKFGIFLDPFTQRGGNADAHLGRFTVTRRESDRHVFRVPSLRNVAVSAPYFHDGATPSLPEAVDLMARAQLGRNLPAEDIDLIVKFLGTLTGEYEGRPLTPETDRSPR
jgi:cytochrome c peroxidase